MPAYFLIDTLNRVVFSRAFGILTYSECTAHMDHLSADPRFNPDFNQIFDFSEVTELSLSTDQLQQLAKRSIFSAKSRRAYVVSGDLHFGLSRMFSALRETEGEPGIVTFRDLPSAIIWTDAPKEVAHKAFADLRQQCQPA